MGLTWWQAPIYDRALQSSDFDLSADGVDVVLTEADDAVPRAQVVQRLQRIFRDGKRGQALVCVDLGRLSKAQTNNAEHERLRVCKWDRHCRLRISIVMTEVI